MGDKPKSHTEANPSASGGAQQSELDALLQEAAAGNVVRGAKAAPPAAVPADSAFEESEIDALLGGAAGVTPDPVADSRAPSGAASAQGDPSGSVAAMAHPASYELPDFTTGQGGSVDPKRVSMLEDVNLRVKVELGRTRMLVEDVLKLGEGSVVELDKLAGDPVDIIVNDRLIARGEVLVLNDSFCVRVNEVITNNPHRVTA